MEKLNQYNIKFIKINGIVYTLGLLYIPISLLWKANTSSNGGNNGGTGGAIYVYTAYTLIPAIAITILNFRFSKPKPKKKYLRFFPILILIAFAIGLINPLFSLVGIIFLFIKVLRK